MTGEKAKKARHSEAQPKNPCIFPCRRIPLHPSENRPGNRNSLISQKMVCDRLESTSEKLVLKERTALIRRRPPSPTASAMPMSWGDSGNGGDEPCGLDLPHGLNRLRHIFHACWIAAFRYSLTMSRRVHRIALRVNAAGVSHPTELSGLQRPNELVMTEDDAGRECFRAGELE